MSYIVWYFHVFPFESRCSRSEELGALGAEHEALGGHAHRAERGHVWLSG